jgi:hypothetical protein
MNDRAKGETFASGMSKGANSNLKTIDASPESIDFTTVWKMQLNDY